MVRRRMRRDTVVEFCTNYPACVVAMEACCGAHHIGRALAAKGHEIRLMSPEYVRPYVKAQKNDDRDAEAIAEAASRPTMRFVTLKSEEQLDMQTLHRVRDRLVGDRTSLMNRVRSLLLERGHVVAQGRAQLAAALSKLLDGDGRVLAPRIHELIADMRRQWVALDERIKAFDAEFAAAAKAQHGANRLLSIPGIGALNATALVAAVGDAGTFARGRDLAAWLGLVPRQVTTGGRPKLLGITKRGSTNRLAGHSPFQRKWHLSLDGHHNTMNGQAILAPDDASKDRLSRRWNTVDKVAEQHHRFRPRPVETR